LFVSGSRNVPFGIIGRDKSRPYTVFMNMFLSRNPGHRPFQPQKQAFGIRVKSFPNCAGFSAKMLSSRYQTRQKSGKGN